MCRGVKASFSPIGLLNLLYLQQGVTLDPNHGSLAPKGNVSSFFVSFNFFSFIFISWRLITLQYCGGFCHTLGMCLLRSDSGNQVRSHVGRMPEHDKAQRFKIASPGSKLGVVTESIVVVSVIFS